MRYKFPAWGALPRLGSSCEFLHTEANVLGQDGWLGIPATLCCTITPAP